MRLSQHTQSSILCDRRRPGLACNSTICCCLRAPTLKPPCCSRSTTPTHGLFMVMGGLPSCPFRLYHLRVAREAILRRPQDVARPLRRLQELFQHNAVDLFTSPCTLPWFFLLHLPAVLTSCASAHRLHQVPRACCSPLAPQYLPVNRLLFNGLHCEMRRFTSAAPLRYGNWQCKVSEMSGTCMITACAQRFKRSPIAFPTHQKNKYRWPLAATSENTTDLQTRQTFPTTYLSNVRLVSRFSILDLN